jgi:hypothetical protein
LIECFSSKKIIWKKSGLIAAWAQRIPVPSRGTSHKFCDTFEFTIFIFADFSVLRLQSRQRRRAVATAAD